MKKVSVVLWTISGILISDAIKASVIPQTFEVDFLATASVAMAVPLIAIGLAFWAADE